MKQQIKMILAGATAIMMLPAAVGAGAAEMPNKPHETQDTLSSIGSVSKMFVTTAAMQLADQGKLDIDAPVTDYLPEFRMADSRYKDITVRMLMNHRSGLMGSYYCGDILFGDRSSEIHDDLLSFLSTERLKAAPGAYGSYCNDGFELLELIVERVSGERFTDYMENHICKPLGMQQTGSQWNAFFTDEQVRVFYDKTEFTPDFCMTIGGGGVLSTAPELCAFGSAFFTGDTTLLSDSAKDAMRTRQDSDPYEDGFGLGWDSVGDADYDAAGVQVVSKGGDIQFQHAELAVAPDQKISVAVLSSGGGSGSDAQLAKALMDIALEEQGITVTHRKPEIMETVDNVPAEYLQHEGLWMNSMGLWQLSFPQQKYLRLTCLSDPRSEDITAYYTTSGVFVEVMGNPEAGTAKQVSGEQKTIDFTERDGETFLVYGTVSGDENLGYSVSPVSYAMQRVPENPVSEAVQAAWEARNGKRYYVYNARYSDSAYCDNVVVRLLLPAGVGGYADTLALRDETHAETVLHVPNTTSRDQTDVEIRYENGSELLCRTAQGYQYIREDAIPALPENLTDVRLTTGAAAWYNISSDTDRSVTLELPEHAAVYVYDKRDRMVWSSLMIHSGDTAPLPAGGKIVFLGETGGTVGIH